MTDTEKLKAVLDYCHSRLASRLHDLNGEDWLAGYEYALRRLISISRTGEIYHEPSKESRKSAEITQLKKALEKTKSGNRTCQKWLDEGKTRISQIEARLREMGVNL